MKKYPILVPSAGESITTAQIALWCKQSGDIVAVDEVLLELETEKATLEVVSEFAGVLRIIESVGTVVKVGQVVANIEEAVSGSADLASTQAVSSVEKSSPPVKSVANETGSSHPKGLSDALGHPFPAAAALLQEKKLNPQDVTPTGVGGRITLSDVSGSADLASTQTVSSVEKSSPPVKSVANVVPTELEKVGEASRTQPLSMLRKTIANRLMRSHLTKATLTTFNEVDMHALIELRKTYKDEFLKKHDVKLGMSCFFVKAAAQGLKAYPAVAAAMDDQNLLFPGSLDVSVAVATSKGLVVPVLRQVDKLSLAQIESQVAFLAKKARDGKLTPQDMSGGCFTITNGGVFGSMLSTPIINGEQSAIMGMHNIVERPWIVNGQIVSRPIMYLALSYDHRVIDGEQAVKFLVTVKQCIEDPLRLLVDL